jgi:hypothetical protein
MMKYEIGTYIEFDEWTGFIYHRDNKRYYILWSDGKHNPLTKAVLENLIDDKVINIL